VKHQWVNQGDISVYRVCSQCGYRIPVSRDVDPVTVIAVEDCLGPAIGRDEKVEDVLRKVRALILSWHTKSGWSPTPEAMSLINAWHAYEDVHMTPRKEGT